MRLDIADELAKPLGHLCVDRGIKATEYMNDAVRFALVMDGEITGGDGLDRPIPSKDELVEAILFVGNSPVVRRLPAKVLWGIALLSSFAGRFVDVVVPVDLTVSSKPIELPDLPAEESPP